MGRHKIERKREKKKEKKLCHAKCLTKTKKMGTLSSDTTNKEESKIFIKIVKIFKLRTREAFVIASKILQKVNSKHRKVISEIVMICG